MAQAGGPDGAKANAALSAIEQAMAGAWSLSNACAPALMAGAVAAIAVIFPTASSSCRRSRRNF